MFPPAPLLRRQLPHLVIVVLLLGRRLAVLAARLDELGHPAHRPLTVVLDHLRQGEVTPCWGRNANRETELQSGVEKRIHAGVQKCVYQCALHVLGQENIHLFNEGVFAKITAPLPSLYPRSMCPSYSLTSFTPLLTSFVPLLTSFVPLQGKCNWSKVIVRTLTHLIRTLKR